MAILATPTSTPRELVPPGNYVARCYEIVQIGTIKEVINGETKIQAKVVIGWEFPNDQKIFDEAKGPQPITFHKEYTLSTGERSNLRKMLASWRGKDFTHDEAKAFDVTVLLGVPCMVNIIHKPKKSDPSAMYADIGSVSNIPKGLSVPPAINTPVVIEYDNFDFNKFEALPDFIKAKMRTSIEFAALTTPTNQQVASGHQDELPAPVRTATGDLPATDDLPF